MFQGVFHMYGYGRPINYHTAVNLFEKAAHMNDPHIQEKASIAVKELLALLDIANEKNEAILNRYQ
jgi:hypothetical protein